MKNLPSISLSADMLLAVLLASAPAVGLAQEKTFDLGDGPVVLADVTDQVGVRYVGMRFVPGQDVWYLDISLTNRSAVAIPAPIVMWIDSYSGTSGPMEPDGTEGSDPAHPYYDFTAETADGLLWPGNQTLPRTLTLGYSGGAPDLVTRVYAQLSSLPSGLALVRTLNEAGQPLRGVRIIEDGPLATIHRQSDPVFGLVTVGQTNGLHTWQFDLEDHLPVWRQHDLQRGQVTLLPTPRLTRRAASTTMSLAGGDISNGSIQITVPPGAFSQETEIRVTPLTAQTLPAPLPLGWSPLQAFWLETATEPLTQFDASISLWDRLRSDETSALVRWNPGNFTWDVARLITGPGSSMEADLPGSGAFAIVVPDTGDSSPPPAVAGEVLTAAETDVVMPIYSDLIAGGRVEPEVSIASLDPARVTGTAHLAATNVAGPLPSGLLLRCDVGEVYRMMDGNVRRTPRYENFVIGYQRPGDILSDTLHASFPMRPQLLFTARELAQATIRADVLPPPTTNLRVLGPEGGLATVGAVTLRAAAGDLESRQVLQIRPLNPDDLILLSLSNYTAVAGFDLGVARVAKERHLELQVVGAPANALFVLARVMFSEGWFGLQPVERLGSDSEGNLASLEPVSGERLPGIAGAGQYALLRVPAAQGLITGVASDSSGQPAAGLLMRIEGQPWLTLSSNGGEFHLVAPAGAAGVEVTDPATGDTGLATVEVVAIDTPATADPAALPSGPSVVSVSPMDGATGVPRVSSVIVSFSEPIQPGSMGVDGIQLLRANGDRIAASLTLNQENTVATLLPVAQLAANTTHTIRVSTGITDANGLPLEGTNEFTFTTETDSLDRLAALVISYEPVNGMAAMTGSPGTADPESPVILVNDTTGQTATVLSKADGSFSNSVPADVDDFLSAVVVNRNGTQNTMPVSRQIFRDGSVGLFNGGGILEAESDGGPVQVFVEPGSIPNKTIFKLESVSLTQVLALLGDAPPAGGKVLGGFRLETEGDQYDDSAAVAYPVGLEDLGLPGGTAPEEATFALAIPHRLEEGGVAYEVIDKMEYENGALVTRSPPFPGLVYTTSPVLYTPIYVGLGAPITIWGQVLAGEVDGTGNLVEEEAAVKVIGADVVGVKGSTFQDQGLFTSGTLFAKSRSPNGTYALTVPATADGAFVGLFAEHPSFANPSWPTSVFVTSGGATKNIIFPPADPGAIPDTIAPILYVDHEPDEPEINETVELRVRSIDDQTPPDITVTLEDVAWLDPEEEDTLPGQQILTAESPTYPNATTTSQIFTFEVAHPARLEFSVEASDNFNPSISLTHVVYVGEESVPVTDDLVSPDENDEVGPTVVSSYPAEGSLHLLPGEAIRIQFNESISVSVLEEADTIKLNPTDPLVAETPGTPFLELNDTQTELTLRFAKGMLSDTEYQLVLGDQVQDLNGNILDWIPADDDDDPTNDNTDEPFQLTFRTAPVRVSDGLPGLEAGGGLVIRGRYAYVLERLGTQPDGTARNGAVLVYDLADPVNPELIETATLSVPGYPRDLELIPRYSFLRDPDPDAEPETKDLLAVVGGVAGRTFGQYLWIIDISDPEQPVRIAGRAVTSSASSIAMKLAWSPPVLGYLLLGGQDSVNIVNLQKFIFASDLTEAEYEEWSSDDPIDQAGVDLNGDGDYVDDGESLPLLPRSPTFFPGWEKGHVVPDTDQTIIDFNLQLGGEFVGALLRSGYVLDANGKPSSTKVAASYRTLHFGEQVLERELASFEFGEPDYEDSIPKRLTTLFDISLPVTNTVQRVTEEKTLNLALVSLNFKNSDNTREPRLIVLDITDANAVSLLAQIKLPTDEETGPYSLRQREDGTLVLALRDSLVLLDPTLFGLIPPDEISNEHPAIQGIIPGIGSTHPSYSVSLTGLIGVSDGRSNKIMQVAPWMRFVQARELTPFDPSDKVDLPDDELADLIAEFTSVNHLRLSRYEEYGASYPSDVKELNPETHYNVLVQAPGAAGPHIDLGIQSLTWTRAALPKKGFLFPPVHALSESALEAIQQSPGDADPTTRTVTAWRLSSDPTSEFYDYFLSRSIVFLEEEISPEALEEIRDPGTIQGNVIPAAVTSPPREVIWSGAGQCAFPDPSFSTNSVLGEFAAEVDSGKISPRVLTESEGYPGDYIKGPNPAPTHGEAHIGMAGGAVQAHNGELVSSTVDLALPGKRLPVVIQRTYRGQDLYAGRFGRGWDFNYNLRVKVVTEDLIGADGKVPQVLRDVFNPEEVIEPGDLLFINGAGRNLVYKGVVVETEEDVPVEIRNDPLYAGYKGFGPIAFYLPPTGVYNYFVEFPTGVIMRLAPDGTISWFNTSGRLEKIQDRFKNQLKFSYNSNGDLCLIKDELNREIQFGYYRIEVTADCSEIDEEAPNDASIGKICRIKDYSGRDVTYHYDENGLLEQFKGPKVLTVPIGAPPELPGPFAGRKISHYTYSGIDDPTKTALSIVQVQYLSDVPGIGEEEASFTVTKQGAKGRDAIEEISDASGANVVIEQGYENSAEGMSDSGDPLVVVTKAVQGKIQTIEYRFDSKGRLKQLEQQVLTGSSEPLLTVQDFDPDTGKLIGITLPEENRIEFSYDTNNPSLRSRGNLLEIRKIPDADRGGEVLTASFEYEDYYQLGGMVEDFNGNTIERRWSGDFLEEHVSYGNPEVAKTEKWFYEDGLPSFELNMDGTHRYFGYYEDTGFLKSIQHGSSDPVVTSYSYGVGMEAQARGLPESISYPDGTTTRFIYDERNQLVETETGGAIAQYTYDLHGNPAGNAILVENNTWLVTSTEYNQFGFLEQEIIHNVEVDGVVTDLKTQYIPTVGDHRLVDHRILPNGEVHYFTYDDLGRLEASRVSGDQPDYIETYEYDLNSNTTNVVVGEVTGDHNDTATVYDGHDRPILQVAPSGLRQEIEYDNNGNVLSVINFQSDSVTKLSQEWTVYDAANRVKEAYRLRGDEFESETEKEIYTYVTTGQLYTEVQDGSGGFSKQTYDSAGRPEILTTPTTQVENTYNASAPAQLFRRRIDFVDPTGRYLEEGFAYNDRYQLTARTNTVGDAIQYPEIGFDGRVLEVRDEEGHSDLFSYTVLGEMTSETDANDVTRSYTFDDKRNPKSDEPETGGEIDRGYDGSGRLTSLELPNGEATHYSAFNYLGLPQNVIHPRDIVENRIYDRIGRLDSRRLTLNGGDREEDFGYDELDRPTHIEVPDGTVSFEYDKLGFVDTVTYDYAFAAQPFVLTQQANDTMQRTHFSYPDLGQGDPDQVLIYHRERSFYEGGRLVGLTTTDGDDIVFPTTDSIVYAADTLVDSINFGGNTIIYSVEYDDLLRPTKLRYEKPDGTTLVETRYAYNRAGIQRARQFIHRGGRADIFTYDDGYRLENVEHGARPDLGAQDGAADIDEWPEWKPGFYFRSYSYAEDSDRLESTVLTVLPNSYSLPFATEYTLDNDADEILFQLPTTSDRVDRRIDKAGNVTQTELLVRIPGSPDPVYVPATLEYNAVNQLVRIICDHGSDGRVTVENTYGPTGLRIRREVDGPDDICVPSDVVYIYDGDLLIEERHGFTSALLARYYYLDGQDVPVAADIYNSVTFELERHYLLTDVQGSVLGIADGNGDVVERVTYDTWGQPRIEEADMDKPVLSQAYWRGDELIFVFSEPVLPPLMEDTGSDLNTTSGNLADALSFESDSGPVPGALVYDESEAAHEFGTVIKFVVDPSVDEEVRFTLHAGSLEDEWGNGVEAVNMYNVGLPGGNVSYVGPPSSTGPTLLSRSLTPFLFHGQVFDHDTGLLYLRARYYDPSAGLFLQPDPLGFEDSANLYAAFANNPVNFRDPSGSSVLDVIENSFWTAMGALASRSENWWAGAKLVYSNPTDVAYDAWMDNTPAGRALQGDVVGAFSLFGQQYIGALTAPFVSLGKAAASPVLGPLYFAMIFSGDQQTAEAGLEGFFDMTANNIAVYLGAGTRTTQVRSRATQAPQAKIEVIDHRSYTAGERILVEQYKALQRLTVEYDNRKVLVVDGQPYFQSTATSGSGSIKNQWYPFHGAVDAMYMGEWLIKHPGHPRVAGSFADVANELNKVPRHLLVVKRQVQTIEELNAALIEMGGRLHPATTMDRTKAFWALVESGHIN